jgi:hypothetical protein
MEQLCTLHQIWFFYQETTRFGAKVKDKVHYLRQCLAERCLSIHAVTTVHFFQIYVAVVALFSLYTDWQFLLTSISLKIFVKDWRQQSLIIYRRV